MTRNNIALDKDADVTPQERADLRKMSKEMPNSDDQALHEASLDETDEDGTPLEEKGLDQDLGGDDLDVPGSDDDDDDFADRKTADTNRHIGSANAFEGTEDPTHGDE